VPRLTPSRRKLIVPKTAATARRVMLEVEMEAEAVETGNVNLNSKKNLRKPKLTKN
jgi:hypothetical protein